MKRKISIIFIMMLIISMMTTICFADDGGIYLGQVDCSKNEGRYISCLYDGTDGWYVEKVQGGTTKPTTDQWAYYEDGTLTLHNFFYDDVYGGSTIFTKGGETLDVLTINLEGENTFGTTINKVLEGIGFGLFKEDHVGKVVITGEGNLTINSQDCAIHTYIPVELSNEFTGTLTLNGGVGFLCTEVIMDNGNVVINADSEGIETESKLIINNGKLEINIKEGPNLGMASLGKFEINGGRVTVKAPNGYAIYHDEENVGTLPKIKRGYLEYITATDLEGTQQIELTKDNAKDICYFYVNYIDDENPIVVEPTPTSNLTLYIAIGCVVLILIIVIAIRKKKY